jgi:hypothetical protein
MCVSHHPRQHPFPSNVWKRRTATAKRVCICWFQRAGIRRENGLKAVTKAAARTLRKDSSRSMSVERRPIRNVTPATSYRVMR